MTKENIIRQAYEAAVERYAAVGVDAREAMDKLQKISLSHLNLIQLFLHQM